MDDERVFSKKIFSKSIFMFGEIVSKSILMVQYKDTLKRYSNDRYKIKCCPVS